MPGWNDLDVRDGTLAIRPRGWSRLWCFESDVRVRLSDIVEVSVDHAPWRVKRGTRGPGIEFFRMRAGTFHPDGEQHFWNYSGRGSALVIGVARGKGYAHRFQRLYSPSVTRRNSDARWRSGSPPGARRTEIERQPAAGGWEWRETGCFPRREARGSGKLNRDLGSKVLLRL